MAHKSHFKELRQKRAQERLEARQERSDEEQLARLDHLLGKDQGAQKERERLQKKISRKTIEKLKKNSVRRTPRKR